ncbi:MAG: hypothetical protein WKF56_00925, partial [Candidatus Limnocylindrales bacterium]
MGTLAFDPSVSAMAAIGIGLGLWLLGRGLTSFRRTNLVGDTSTSSIASMAAGEVRISGVIEPAEVTLISPLQSEACVYYRARIGSEGDRSEIESDHGEERAIGFRVRDPSGDIRVFPRGARWDAPLRLDESSGAFDGEPVGLRVRRGSPIGQAPARCGRGDRVGRVLALTLTGGTA